MKIDIDYKLPGYTFNFSLYSQYPYKDNEEGNSEFDFSIKHLFSAYTTNGKYEGNVKLSSALNDKVYLVSGSIGVPNCVEAVVDNGTIRYSGVSIAVARSVNNQFFESNIITETGLTVTFLDEYDQNSLDVFRYYYYKTGTKLPSKDNLEKFIVFPNVSADNPVY